MLGQRRLAGARLGAAALVLLLATRSAWAASDEEKAGARAAAVEGLKAYTEKRWSDALDLFTRAEALVHSPMHLLYLGRANLELGRLVRAREALMKASRERLDPDSPPAFQRAKDEAEGVLVGLEPRIPYLTLKVEGAPSGTVAVLMDGVKVPAPLIGVPRPVDPGEHKFEGAEGFVADPVVVTIAEAERKTATLVIREVPAAPLPTAAAGSPAAATTAEGAPLGAAPDGKDQPPGKSGPNVLRLASYGAFGVGAVGLGLGIVFGLSATSKRDEANALCDSSGCPQSKRNQIQDLDDSANGASTGAVIGFVLGGVGVAAGTTLFFLSADKGASEAAGVRPWVSVGSAGLAGRFW